MDRAGVAPAGRPGAKASRDPGHGPNPTEEPQSSAQYHQAGSQPGHTRGLNEPGGLRLYGAEQVIQDVTFRISAASSVEHPLKFNGVKVNESLYTP